VGQSWWHGHIHRETWFGGALGVDDGFELGLVLGDDIGVDDGFVLCDTLGEGMKQLLSKSAQSIWVISLACYEFPHGVGGITFTSVVLLGTYRSG
jgi:hypothetical protein